MGRLKCSLLSSFCTRGVLRRSPVSATCVKPMLVYDEIDGELRAANQGKHCPVGVELYIAMEEDLVWLSKMAHGPSGSIPKHKRPLNAASVLAGWRPAEVNNVAAAINKRVRESGAPRDIVAIASFLPEIARGDDLLNPSRHEAVTALSVILEIGRVLRTQYHHPVYTVEAVAGSLFATLDNIWTFDEKRQKWGYEYRVALDERAIVVDRVYQGFCKAIEMAAKQGGMENLPCISIELEPGPYFVVKDGSTLRQFAAHLNNGSATSKLIGFNLDVAHWCIAKIGTDWLDRKANRIIRDRITHAHFSGHHASAHFGDCVPINNEWAKLDDWLDFLREIASNDTHRQRKEQGLPRFSEYVSVELEATSNVGMVRRMFEGLAPRLTQAELRFKAKRQQSREMGPSSGP